VIAEFFDGDALPVGVMIARPLRLAFQMRRLTRQVGRRFIGPSQARC
jgi:hypothetical protein